VEEDCADCEAKTVCETESPVTARVGLSKAG
jgi:hypothetical protein